MKVILDENLPRPLKGIFPNHTVTTVQEQGLAGTVNDALLVRLEGKFDVFITADKNLRYQQNLSGRALSNLELPTNRIPLLRPLFQRIAAAVSAFAASEHIQPRLSAPTPLRMRPTGRSGCRSFADYRSPLGAVLTYVTAC